MQHFSSARYKHGRKTPPLVVVKQDPFLAELLLQHLILGAEILDGSLLFTLNPAGQREQSRLWETCLAGERCRGTAD